MIYNSAFAIAILMLVSVQGMFSADSVNRNTNYRTTLTTLSVGATTYNTIAAAKAGTTYREIELYVPAGTGTLYFRDDGTTTNIETVGVMVSSGTYRTIQTNSAIYFLMGVGTSSTTVRVRIKEQ